MLSTILYVKSLAIHDYPFGTLEAKTLANLTEVLCARSKWLQMRWEGSLRAFSHIAP